MTTTIAGGPAVRLLDKTACGHGDLAYLGAGGDAVYYRCRGCGVGVIEQQGRFWVLRGIAK